MKFVSYILFRFQILAENILQLDDLGPASQLKVNVEYEDVYYTVGLRKR